MEQTRGNYYKMTGLCMAVLTVGVTIAVLLPPAWKAVVPVPQGRPGLFDFVMIVLATSAGLGGFRAALAIQAHWLPKCEISEEQRSVIEKNVLPLRESIDRLIKWLAIGCVVVVLFNYF
ncbi:hypothetical protein [Thiovibrio frasassiensis]|uniref:Uncharacterized protein n=1 Tax=Thiovibrio frasassiensis TaxID=2984131 RepID=A0A9X4RLE2_9BACT|nr:hypothetical protein [Thiovibrio frasassiensis]MDG4475599.1 hypothetical protein [Thiovibrio frasassiensis]